MRQRVSSVGKRNRGRIITVLLYSDWRDRTGLNLRMEIRGLLPDVEVEGFSSPDALALRLRSPSDHHVAAAVLVPPTPHDLDLCLTVAPLLSGLKILLVLPDHHASTIAMGHRLRPSLVTFTDGDPSKVCAVLSKIITKSTSAQVHPA